MENKEITEKKTLDVLIKSIIRWDMVFLNHEVQLVNYLVATGTNLDKSLKSYPVDPVNPVK